MADPDPRPPRGASAARKRSRVRSRGPYQDVTDADESATKAAVTRRSRSTVGRGRGAARAVSVGAAPGVHPHVEPVGVTSVAATITEATPKATHAGAKGAAKGKGAASKDCLQADPAGEADGAALQKDAAVAALQKGAAVAASKEDAAVAASSSGAASPTISRGGEPAELLARSIALCEEIERMQSARQKDSGASEPATDPVDPREGDIERMGAEELHDIGHVACDLVPWDVSGGRESRWAPRGARALPCRMFLQNLGELAAGA
ncbi:hypothetical protein K1T71_005132 [Dendrolimus kikuchii]|uniref:Uncharacterized protein n=1 Tax=Dendrolimus kikuchii TaxID=765133 RepID=A0ACC1D6I6_9NEOP|nr:hypothetical protein K1T71_005132 [Dendrolimus kikuchii]